MRVTLQNVLGHQLTLRTDAKREAAACREALKRAESQYPEQGWMVRYAL